MGIPKTRDAHVAVRGACAEWTGLGYSKLDYSITDRVSAKFKFRFESLKSKSTLIIFLYNLMIRCCIKKNSENYARKCF